MICWWVTFRFLLLFEALSAVARHEAGHPLTNDDICRTHPVATYRYGATEISVAPGCVEVEVEEVPLADVRDRREMDL